MVILPKNWEEIKADNFIELPLRPYTLRITSVSEYKNPNNGNKSLRICYDIEEDNEYKGFFQRMYENSKDKRWPNTGTKYLSLKTENLSYLKGFTEAVEKSNNIKLNIIPGFDLDLDQFIGLLVGGDFGYEEYERDGEIKLRLSLFKFKSLDQLPYLRKPQVKTLDGEYVPYELYNTNTENEEISEDSILPAEEELPF